MTKRNEGRMRVIPDDVLSPDIKISLWEVVVVGGGNFT